MEKARKTLFEIYRACRLCGTSTGYKMPIDQSILQVERDEIDLKRKIRECLQIEVRPDDKMPPLICELCADKVSQFYDFLNVCRQTNIMTRKRLGLPIQNSTKDVGTETCLLGLVDPSTLKTEEEPAKKANIKPKRELKRESSVKSDTSPATKVLPARDIANKSTKESDRRREPRLTRNSMETTVTLEEQKDKIQEPSKPGPKSKKDLRKETKIDLTKTKVKEDPKQKGKTTHTSAKEIETTVRKGKKDGTNTSERETETTPRKGKRDEPACVREKQDTLKSKGKREIDDESTKLKRKMAAVAPPPSKKAKLPDQKPPSKSKPKPPPKVSPTQKKEAGLQCPACGALLKHSAGFKNHMHILHPVTWTPDNLACNACREWFPTIEESVAHHKKHSHYRCYKCKHKFKNGVQYDLHIENKRCVKEKEIPDYKCDFCWKYFPTQRLIREHNCLGPDHRPGGKCSKCNQHYSMWKSLARHETSCMAKEEEKSPEPPQPGVIIDPEVKQRLLPMEVRITKCDDLLLYGPVVSACTVPYKYGLDRRFEYPYMPQLRFLNKPITSNKSENKEKYTDDFGWDDFEDIELRTVKKLSTLCIKVIFSDKMLGEKVILYDIEIKRRSALKKRIDSIIFQMEDSNSCGSDSLLNKNALPNCFDLIEMNDSVENVTELSKRAVSGDEVNNLDVHMDRIDKPINVNIQNDIIKTDNMDADEVTKTLADKSKELSDIQDINEDKDVNLKNVDTDISRNVSNVENNLDAVLELDKSIECKINDVETTDSVKITDNSQKTEVSNDENDSSHGINIIENIDERIKVNSELANVETVDNDRKNIVAENDSENENVSSDSVIKEYCTNIEQKNVSVNEKNIKTMEVDETSKGSEIMDIDSCVNNSGEESLKNITILSNSTHTDNKIESSESTESNNLNRDSTECNGITDTPDETEGKSPQKGNKSLDFSVSGILNYVTSKDVKVNTGSNNTQFKESEDIIAQNSVVNCDANLINAIEKSIEKQDKEIAENLIENHSNVDSVSTNSSSMENHKNDDGISLNSIISKHEKSSDDTRSVIRNVENIQTNSHKHNDNDLSEEEKRLMAEIDEQIGETNDKIHELNNGKNVGDNSGDSFNFDV